MTVRSAGGIRSANLFSMTRQGPLGTLVLMPGLDGTVLYSRHIAAALGPEVGCVGVRLDRSMLDDVGSLTVEGMGLRFAQAIAAADLPRPFHLVGYSFGGFLALEAGRHLEALGAPADELWLLDTLMRKRGLRDLPRSVLRHVRHHGPALLGIRPKPHIHYRFGWRRLDLSRFPASSWPIARALFEVRAKYRAEPWPTGRAVLVQAARGSRRDDVQQALGWKGLVPGCEIVSLPVDHDSILHDAEGVARLASAIRGRMTADGSRRAS